MKFKYVDGCSYLAGHSKETTGAYSQWLYPDLMLGGLYHVENNLNNFIWNQASTGKSNDYIFADFLKYFNKIKGSEDPCVFIQWSHAERYISKIDNKGIYVNKNLTGAVNDIVPQGINAQSDPDEHMLGCVEKTAQYMLAVEKLCQAFGVRYRCITEDPEYLFLQTESGPQLNKSKIFNWNMPEPRLIKYKDNKEWSQWWALKGFTLNIGKTFGANYIADDLKHLNKRGHECLGRMIEFWFREPDKNLRYYYDEVWSANQRRLWTDFVFNYETSLEMFKEERFSKIHWVEQMFEDAPFIDSAITYIYEQ